VSAPDAEPRGAAGPGGEALPGERAAGGGEARPGDGSAAGGEARPGDNAAPADEATTPAGGMERGYARSRARADAIRAQLEPLGPDERPLGLKLAIGLALLIAVANLIGAAAGAGGSSPVVGVAFALFMLVLAAGMWQRRYVVILLFQALLAITIIVSTLSLAFARTATQAAVAVLLIALSAPVFWLLIRVMARLQVPRA
jgi:hypothetical protein